MSAPIRRDWMPQTRAELCACISVLALSGKLSPDDQQHVADWIQFRMTASHAVHEDER